MHWVIQSNVAKEENHQDFIDMVGRIGDDYTVVDHIPFTLTLEPEPNIKENDSVIAIGSVKLTQTIALIRGWNPGAFTNSNFNFEVWSKAWSGHTLNEDATVTTFGNIPLYNSVFFIRPTKDNKAFTGQVMDLREYQRLLGRMESGEEASDVYFTIDEPVLVSSPKNIQKEFRFFIVDDEVITHSTYKNNNRSLHLEETYTDPDAIDFVKNMIKIWTPADAFVLDVAMVDDEYKIIEINCINCSGFYRANVGKIVEALHNLIED